MTTSILLLNSTYDKKQIRFKNFTIMNMSELYRRVINALTVRSLILVPSKFLDNGKSAAKLEAFNPERRHPIELLAGLGV